ncbi:hypothetical protein KKB10_00285 [Patescibacteria group bacterium]|nr:hypothetical protein [Patescibacteria group bacterium]MBU1951587.1 hypothetical protein [Patescibacteria group bacterium]
MSDLMLDVDQAGELKAAFRRGDWTNTLIKRACEGDFLAQFKRVVEGSATIIPIAPKKEIPVTTIVHIDRSIKPTYPDFVKKVMHPGLESAGLVEYDIATAISLWLHDNQKKGIVTGQVIYNHLKKNNMLGSCGNLQDALAIQKLGVASFQKAFGNIVVYFWKSVVQRRNGSLDVPCLCVRGGGVVLYWNWLDDVWHGGEPAVRFAK